MDTEYTFTEDYVNSSTKIRVIHNVCGYIYKVNPNSFLSGRRCPKCSEVIRLRDRGKRIDWFEVVETYGKGDYEIMGEIKTGSTKTTLRHLKCGQIYEVRLGEFRRGSRCPICSHIKGTKAHTKSNETFIKEVNDIRGKEYTFKEEYKNTYTPIRVIHNECGREYKVAPRDFLKGSECRECQFSKRRKTQEEWEEDVFRMVGKEYELIDAYYNDQTNIRIKHMECGNILYMRPNNFMNGTRCRYCKQPKGERILQDYFLQEGFATESQKTFPDLKNVFCLSYDFYLIDYGILIEYQGEQHYRPIEYFGGEESFLKQIKRDEMKRAYAKENGYSLIEVPYTYDTKESIKEFMDTLLLKHIKSNRNATSLTPRSKIMI